MVIFIFTYNYLHKFDEAAAVRSSVLFGKAKLTTFSTIRPWHSLVCVSGCLCGLVTVSLPWFFFDGIISLSAVNPSLFFPTEST